VDETDAFGKDEKGQRLTNQNPPTRKTAAWGSPTEGLKINIFPCKRHQTRHLDFAFFGC
jgi:hypothetical protein